MPKPVKTATTTSSNPKSGSKPESNGKGGSKTTTSSTTTSAPTKPTPSAPKPSPKPQPKGKPSKGMDRPVIYPDIVVKKRWKGGDEEGPLTIAEIEQILGWCEDEEEARKAGVSEPLFLDRNGNPVWLLNNLTNRPFYKSNCEDLMQKQLTKGWVGPSSDGRKINGETIIITETGWVSNGQHQMVAAKWAQQELLGPRGQHWHQYWPDGKIVLDKLVVYGVGDDDATMNSQDTARPRTPADVLYRSHHFQKLSPSDRKTAGKILEGAVKFLWGRVGMDKNVFNSRRTNDEVLSFVENHRKLPDSVLHVIKSYKTQTEKEEMPGWRANNLLLGASYLSGLMYLMGVSASDPAAYHDLVRQGEPSERKGKKVILDFSLWEMAEKFITAFATYYRGNQLMINVREEIAMTNDVSTGAGGSIAEKTGIIAKAWHAFLNTDGKKISTKDVKLKYRTNKLGYQVLDEWPTIGGVDLGDPSRKTDVKQIDTDDDKEDEDKDQEEEEDDFEADFGPKEGDDEEEEEDEGGEPSGMGYEGGADADEEVFEWTDEMREEMQRIKEEHMARRRGEL